MMNGTKKTQKKLISVIVPVYNSEKYLVKCLNSIIKSSSDFVEIIIVDDGSTDNSPIICDKFKKKSKNIRVIHQNNSGVSIARRNGVALSNGEYLSFIDSDDWVEIDYFSKILKIIQSYSPDVICFGCYNIFEKKKKAFPISNQSVFYDRTDIQRIIFPYLIENDKGNYFPNELALKVIKKELYINYQVTDKIEMGEDGACVKPCIANAQRIYIDNEIYYNYRRTNDSVTISGRPISWDGPLLIAEHYKKYLDFSKYDFKEQVCRNFVHNLFNVAVTQYSSNRPYSVVTKEIKRELNKSCYSFYINNAHFISVKGIVCKLAVRFKICFIIYLRWLQKYRIK